MGWNHDEWAALGSVLSGFATAAGVFGAGWYFLLRWLRGYHITNLAVAVACKRFQSTEAGSDWLSIRVTLKKLDRGSLRLHDAQARVSHRNGREEVSFWGLERFQDRLDHTAKRRVVVWDQIADDKPRLNLTPGEETQLAHFVRVPSGEACRVDVVVLGGQHGQQLRGQWKASDVSLPIA